MIDTKNGTNHEQLVAILAEAFEKASFVKILYRHLPTEELSERARLWRQRHPEYVEAPAEPTYRYILPLTPIVQGTRHQYVTCWCDHAANERSLALQQAATPMARRIASHMTPRRCFALDGIEGIEEELHPMTGKYRYQDEIVDQYPQVRTKMGLKAVYVEHTNEDSGEVHKERVLVAA